MGNLKGVEIVKGSVGANATAPDTSISAMLFTGVAITGKVEAGKVYKVNTLKQVENMGITSDYDTANKVIVHQHFVDFYSYPNNSSVTIYFMIVDKESANNTPSLLLQDDDSEFAKKLLISGSGSIKQLGLVFNLPNDYSETTVDGLNSDIRAAIAKAQGLYEWAYSTDRPCNIVLEGRGISDTLSSLLNLRNITLGDNSILEADKVSIVIGQDWDYADTLSGLLQKYAGVGKALGAVAQAQVNQSIAEAGINGTAPLFNLSNAIKGTWVTGGLSNHKTIADCDNYLQDLEDSGYIFPITRYGVTGLRWNGDHVCTPIKVDDDGNINEHEIYYGRTMDYAALQLKSYLMQLVKQRVAVDTKTGLLPTAVVKQLNAGCDKNVFDTMQVAGLISGGKTTINPQSQVEPPDNKLQATFNLVPTAILDEISGTIYLSKTITT